MANIIFKAQKRTDFGTAASKRLRRVGRVPAVIYGNKVQETLDLDAREFGIGIRGVTESTIVSVDIDGKAHEAFIKDTQRDIKNGDILHVDFYEIEPGKPLRAHVPLKIFGNPVGVRDGGILEIALHQIEVECLPKDLPPRVEVDIAALKANQTVHVRDLSLGDGVKLLSGGDQVVALVKFAKAEKAAAETTAEVAAAPGAAPAAAAPAAKEDAKK
jgi:large subunit ribosomal protein L25